MKIEELILGLKTPLLGDKRKPLEAALSEQKISANDMLEQLEASTGKKWRIVPYANTVGMIDDVEEMPPFWDTYCTPLGGIIFVSEKSEFYNQDFVMLTSERDIQEIDQQENIMLECGRYHIRYVDRDKSIKNNITYDTKIVDLLRRGNSVIGAYTAREKRPNIDVFDDTVDSRIVAYVERVLQEAYKDVDIKVDGEDPVSAGAPRGSKR